MGLPEKKSSFISYFNGEINKISSPEEVLQIFKKIGVFLKGHFVFTNNEHSNLYINKDAIYPYTQITSHLCRLIAEKFSQTNVEVVIAPAVGGVILSQWVAFHLTRLSSHQILAAYAEKTENNQFAIKRGYDQLIPGKNVLVVEDVLTTGGSARKVVELTRALGGNVIGLGVLCNRGGVSIENVGGIPKFFALTEIKTKSWKESKCPLCAQGIPINTDVGKGREYLLRRRAELGS